MSGLGYQGDFDVADTSHLKAPELTEADLIAKDLSKSSSAKHGGDTSEDDQAYRNLVDERDDPDRGKPGMSTIPESDRAMVDVARKDPLVMRAVDENLPPSKLRKLEELQAIIDGKDRAAATHALAILKNQADKSDQTAVRAYASKVLYDKYQIDSDARRERLAADAEKARENESGMGGTMPSPSPEIPQMTFVINLL